MADYLSKRNSFPIIDLMHHEFQSALFISCTTIMDKISSVYKEYHVVKEDITASEIKLFFDCKLTTRKILGKSVKGYILFAPKQNQHPDYIRN